jgi:hypothetical protein
VPLDATFSHALRVVELGAKVCAGPRQRWPEVSPPALGDEELAASRMKDQLHALLRSVIHEADGRVYNAVKEQCETPHQPLRPQAHDIRDDGMLCVKDDLHSLILPS